MATSNSNGSGRSLPPFDATPAHRLFQPPDPEWTLGEGIRNTDDTDKSGANELRKTWNIDEKRGCRIFDLDTMEKSAAYKLLTSAVVPRPVAFVSSLSSDGVPNLAPFSYFSLISHNPPLITVAFTLSPSRPKDTRENVLATRQFVVNIISEPFVEAANACSVEAPADVDEWKLSGLTPEPCEIVRPPRVRESAVSLECELYTHIDIPRGEDLPPISSSAPTETLDPKPGQEPGTTLVVARVRRMHVRKAVLRGAPPSATSFIGLEREEVEAEMGKKANESNEGEEEAAEPPEVDPFRLRPIARLGGVRFGQVGAGFDILRPRWRDVEPEAEKLGARVSNSEKEDAKF